ncbi:hypothetical protein V5799_010612 [Amblyomma americanum]|uniref:Secreted protein n=1 Tax=Amblyomma americanum TaxID=6943 RepID=A0AAQ4EJJ4_AMBAM
MLALILCIFALAAGSYVSAIHYEDNPRNFHRQRISEMTAIDGMLFVKSRNFPSNLILNCYAIKKERQLSSSTFQYMVYTAPQPPQGVYNIHGTVVTTETTSRHTAANAIRFQTAQGVQPSLFKLMYIDEQRSCLILVRMRIPGVRGEYFAHKFSS